ncbi:hypothetical protein V2H45_07445 [Tumidithrix elongata RA019]|uniref:Uncharacterized protein n=1 Tax=Tumidithrix elongata BACA0141 TaxID=2716417 RepID=A0AAW9PQD3_9CYAN|nr:hypothetical protein [Tumidithrix elongata RA019]
MKLVSRVFSLGLPFAATITAIASSPAFAQVTNIPITGTMSGSISGAPATYGKFTVNSYQLLSPVGTVSGSIGDITSVTSSPLSNVQVTSISTGSTYFVQGIVTGGVAFNDGRTASFVNAPSTANVTVQSISTGSPLVFSALPLSTNVSLGISDGNIAIPTNSIVAAPVTPITTPTITVTSLGIASALVILDPKFNPPPSTGNQVITAFSPSMDSKIFPGLQP